MFLTEERVEVTLVRITDELDSKNSQEAKEFFSAVVHDKTPLVAVDLSHLSFVDSSGLGALVAGVKTARQLKGDLRLFGLTGPVRAIFDLTRLSRLFEIFDDEDQAVESFH